jgi:hypothetical protein
MRRLLAFLLVLIATACASGPRPAPSLDRPAGITDAEEQAFLAEWYQGRQDSPEARERAPQTLQLAYAVCADLGRGTPYNELIDKAVEYGADAMVFGPLVATAVTTMCPEHAPTPASPPTS